MGNSKICITWIVDEMINFVGYDENGILKTSIRDLRGFNCFKFESSCFLVYHIKPNSEFQLGSYIISTSEPSILKCHNLKNRLKLTEKVTHISC